MTEYKSKLSEVVKGDQVVVAFGSNYGYKIMLCTVERVTLTQVILSRGRFRKQDGKEVGSSYSTEAIYAPMQELDRWNKRDGLVTWLDKYNYYKSAEDLKKAKAPFIRFIESLPYGTLEQVSLENLQEAAKWLGYTDDEL